LAGHKGTATLTALRASVVMAIMGPEASLLSPIRTPQNMSKMPRYSLPTLSQVNLYSCGYSSSVASWPTYACIMTPRFLPLTRVKDRRPSAAWATTTATQQDTHTGSAREEEPASPKQPLFSSLLQGTKVHPQPDARRPHYGATLSLFEKAKVRKVFKRLDTNNDGVLSRDEFLQLANIVASTDLGVFMFD
jgi:hypothetical protein